MKRQFTPQNLPSYTPSDTANCGLVVPIPDGAEPQAPEGFYVGLVASGLEGLRAIRMAPIGDFFIFESKSNQIKVR